MRGHGTDTARYGQNRGADGEGAQVTSAREVLAERVVGQKAVHEGHGGVVPRLAASAHARVLPELVRAYVRRRGPARGGRQISGPTAAGRRCAGRQAGHGMAARTLDDCKLEVADLDAVAVTRGPGLGPCLSVGLNAAKTLAAVSRLPLLGVHHMVAPRRPRPPAHPPAVLPS